MREEEATEEAIGHLPSFFPSLSFDEMPYLEGISWNQTDFQIGLRLGPTSISTSTSTTSGAHGGSGASTPSTPSTPSASSANLHQQQHQQQHHGSSRKDHVEESLNLTWIKLESHMNPQDVPQFIERLRKLKKITVTQSVVSAQEPLPHILQAPVSHLPNMEIFLFF